MHDNLHVHTRVLQFRTGERQREREEEEMGAGCDLGKAADHIEKLLLVHRCHLPPASQKLHVYLLCKNRMDGMVIVESDS